MDTNLILKKLASRQPLFDSIPTITQPRICGLESEYGAVGPRGEFSAQFLSNGGLVYMDCGHPEYATPETTNPLSATLYYEAGKIICNSRLPELRLYCHNNAWRGIENNNPKGVSFGAHESYCTRVPRSKWSKFVPFLIARTVMCAAGWVTWGDRFEISQRASHITSATADGTVDDRPIVNLRNDPLMDIAGYDRLHIICGDATMNQVSTFLRVGTMLLVVEMLEMNALPEVDYDLGRASKDIKGISRKTSDWYLGGVRGKHRGLVALLNLYYERAQSLFSRRDIVTDTLLVIWKDTLEKLARNPMELHLRVDWAAKLMLLKEFKKGEKGWTWDRLRDIDMEYHDLDPERGLQYYLMTRSQSEQLFAPELIAHAIKEPPPDTRAYARGKLIQYLELKGGNHKLIAPKWDELNIVGQGGKPSYSKIPLGNPFLAYSEALADFKKNYK